MTITWDTFATPTKTENSNTRLASKRIRYWLKGDKETSQRAASRRAILREALALIKAGRCNDSGKYVTTDGELAEVSVSVTGTPVAHEGEVSIHRKS